MSLGIKSLIITLLILSTVILSACSSDEEDKQQNQQSTDALKNLDAENQKNRANQPIPNQAPVVTIVSPATGSTVTDSNVVISWTATDTNGDKLALDVGYRPIVAGQTPGEYIQALGPTTPDPKNFTLDLSKLSKGDYELLVRANDGSLSGAAFARFKFQ